MLSFIYYPTTCGPRGHGSGPGKGQPLYDGKPPHDFAEVCRTGTGIGEEMQNNTAAAMALRAPCSRIMQLMTHKEPRAAWKPRTPKVVDSLLHRFGRTVAH